MKIQPESKSNFFSIITVVLNDVTGLSLTCSSLFSQTYTDYEFIIIDGGSNDGTERYLDALPADCNVKFRSGMDDGIYDAMNIGVELSSAEYLVFMNAGDVFFGDNILELVAYRIKDSNVEPDVVFGGANLVFKSQRQLYRPPRDISYVWHGLPANHQASYYRRSVLGSEPYDLKYKICSDYYLDCVLFKEHAISIYIDLPLVRFRVGDSSYKRPFQVLSESSLIQKDVLCLSWILRLVSYMRRVVAISAALILNR